MRLLLWTLLLPFALTSLFLQQQSLLLDSQLFGFHLLYLPRILLPLLSLLSSETSLGTTTTWPPLMKLWLWWWGLLWWYLLLLWSIVTVLSRLVSNLFLLEILPGSRDMGSSGRRDSLSPNRGRRWLPCFLLAETPAGMANRCKMCRLLCPKALIDTVQKDRRMRRRRKLIGCKISM